MDLCPAQKQQNPEWVQKGVSLPRKAIGMKSVNKSDGHNILGLSRDGILPLSTKKSDSDKGLLYMHFNSINERPYS